MRFNIVQQPTPGRLLAPPTRPLPSTGAEGLAFPLEAVKRTFKMEQKIKRKKKNKTGGVESREDGRACLTFAFTADSNAKGQAELQTSRLPQVCFCPPARHHSGRGLATFHVHTRSQRGREKQKKSSQRSQTRSPPKLRAASIIHRPGPSGELRSLLLERRTHCIFNLHL